MHARGVKLQIQPDYSETFRVGMSKEICDKEKLIAKAMAEAGIGQSSLLAVDYFIWDELQVEDNLSAIHTDGSDKEPDETDSLTTEELVFVHNDVRDKVRDIGQWLGFETRTEQKVSEGARVDTVWEATIGNMGRVIYVFEVQTKGNIDSLIVNLLKSLNNPAVQGVVVVSDKEQLQKIEKHANDVPQLREKLKYWDYVQVLQIHQSLEFVNSSINELGLVPQSFY
jgi:hypothetical protein